MPNPATQQAVILTTACWLPVAEVGDRLAMSKAETCESDTELVIYMYQHMYTKKLQVVTDDPGSKPDQKYARRRDRQNYMGRITKRKFAWTIYWYTVRVWTSRLLVLSL